MKILLLPVVLAIALALAGCGLYDSFQQVSRQNPTFANIQAMSFAIEAEIEEGGCIVIDRLEEIAERYNGGRDEWGNEFRFSIHNADDGGESRCSYVVLSTGRDGQLDVEKIEDYFSADVASVIGDFDRDIVFRDGQPLTIASDK